ncbi:glycosyltransferase [Rhizomonospora bruguierae]|uniref:glycosyltransferase n=1 Tax=Rhizomonospora bruguierae TaxID=1581705 RepID=UPI001BCFF3B0|nr:glycosyltransferase [Micromonospora sp. NBRC 107566]
METNTLACSVVIPTYNRADLLRHTLASLAGQSLPRADFEVIVVDDGSGDGTADLVAGFRDRLDLHYFFQPDEGWRAAEARNVGVRHARGQVCVFIDSGVQLHPDCLAAHVAAHRSADGPIAICGYVYGFNMNNEDADLIAAEIDLDDPAATIARWERTGTFLDHRERFYAKYTDEFGGIPAPWVVFWTPNASAGTEQIRAVGGFDNTYRSWGGEDLDLGYRLHRAGARFVLVRPAAAIHLPHPKDKAANEASAALNYQYFAGKYDTPITQIPPLFPKIDPYDMNDVIVERGLPGCAEYLAREGRQPTGGGSLPGGSR